MPQPNSLVARTVVWSSLAFLAGAGAARADVTRIAITNPHGEQRVPMATYTGWNFRGAAIGGTRQLVNLLGTALPLASTKAERHAAHDPRLSVAERYASKSAYAARPQRGDALVTGGYLLGSDKPGVMARVEAQWKTAR